MSRGEGGDRSSEVTCPACGEEIVNTRWPRHLHGPNCDGEVDE